MVYKEESIRERLKRLEEVIARLEKYRGQTLDEFIQDEEKQWLVERGFILAVECLSDIAGHILSGKFSLQPADHEDAIRKLESKGVISQGAAKKLRGLGGFRNILVHEYLRIDPARVHDYLQKELDSFHDFIGEIYSWIRSNP